MTFWIAITALAFATPVLADPPIMPVYAVKADATGITFRLPPLGTGRCTPSRAFLTIAVDKRTDGGALVLVTPRGEPECRSAGGPGEVRWTYEELGLKPAQPFVLGNPLVSEP